MMKVSEEVILKKTI